MEMKIKVYQSPRGARPRFNGRLRKLQVMKTLTHKHYNGKMMLVIKFWKSNHMQEKCSENNTQEQQCSGQYNTQSFYLLVSYPRSLTFPSSL